MMNGCMKKAWKNLKKLMAEKVLIQDEEPCFYIYRQIMGDHEQSGIVAAASVENYNNGIIKIHEHTREDKEQDRAKHVDMLSANTGPVFLTYHAQKSIDALVRKNPRKMLLFTILQAATASSILCGKWMIKMLSKKLYTNLVLLITSMFLMDITDLQQLHEFRRSEKNRIPIIQEMKSIITF